MLIIYKCYFNVVILPPTDVTAQVVTSHRIHVTWKPSSSSHVTGYLISYVYITNASYTSGGNVTVDGGSTTNGDLINLEENTLYNITVRATSSNKVVNNHSNEVLVRTYTDGKGYSYHVKECHVQCTVRTTYIHSS